jgi:hypothetical protein
LTAQKSPTHPKTSGADIVKPHHILRHGFRQKKAVSFRLISKEYQDWVKGQATIAIATLTTTQPFAYNTVEQNRSHLSPKEKETPMSTSIQPRLPLAVDDRSLQTGVNRKKPTRHLCRMGFVVHSLKVVVPIHAVKTSPTSGSTS